MPLNDISPQHLQYDRDGNDKIARFLAEKAGINSRDENIFIYYSPAITTVSFSVYHSKVNLWEPVIFLIYPMHTPNDFLIAAIKRKIKTNRLQDLLCHKH